MALVQKLRPEEAAIVGAAEASRITTEVVTQILRQHADHAVQQAGRRDVPSPGRGPTVKDMAVEIEHI